MKSIKVLINEGRKLSKMASGLETKTGAWIYNCIQAELKKEDLSSLNEMIKENFSVSYAKKINASINLGYKLQIMTDGNKMALLENKGVYALYAQLQAFKPQKEDDKKEVKIKGAKASQIVTDKKGAETSESKIAVTNHAEKLIKSASLSDITDILSSLAEMAISVKDDSIKKGAIEKALLEVEDLIYTIVNQ